MSPASGSLINSIEEQSIVIVDDVLYQGKKQGRNQIVLAV